MGTDRNRCSLIIMQNKLFILFGVFLWQPQAMVPSIIKWCKFMLLVIKRASQIANIIYHVTYAFYIVTGFPKTNELNPQ